MSSLGPEARGFLEEAADVDIPSASDKERIRGRLALQIGLVAAGAAAAGAAKASAMTGAGAKGLAVAAGGGTAALAMKIVGAVAVVGVVAAGVVSMRSGRDAERTLPPETPAHASGGVVASPAPLPQAPVHTGAVVEPTAVSPTPTSTAAHSAVSSPRELKGSAPSDAPAHPSAPDPSPRAPSSASVETSGEGEAALLQKAETAIAAGDGITALAALDIHTKRFPNGILAEQRDGLRVVALCSLGRVPAAREAGERFIGEHPRSSQADRVRRACGLP